MINTMEEAKFQILHKYVGVSVTDVKLTDFISTQNDKSDTTKKKQNAVTCIKALVHKHKVVVFRNQGILTADEQLSISTWFGVVEEAGFEEHPKSPDRHVLRVSNDDSEGFRDFGTSGFHIDGSFMEKPNAFSIYHIINAPSKGGTAFIPLNEVFHQLPVTQQHKWERLWMLKTYKRIRGFRDSPGFVIHPLVYTHPITREKTLCIHQGKTSRFISDWGLSTARWINKEDTNKILEEIDAGLGISGQSLQYHHEWEPGDVIISDNLAVAHLALPETQLASSDVGLRIMHRTVVQGVHRPWKDAKTTLEVLQGHDVDDDEIEVEDEDLVRSHSFGDEDMLHKINARLKLVALAEAKPP